MQTRRRNTFTTIRTEGAILPPDLLQRISEGDSKLEGLKLTDYHLLTGEKLNEAINRSWNRLIGAWESFKTAREKVITGSPGTTETRERWLLPIFQELGYGRLQTSTAYSLNGKSYPISHGWGSAPVHLLGFNIALDKRTPGVAGAATTSPHSMVQEFLNRSDDRLWAFLSNGLQLRILRDNVSLTRQAYVEFDLESMMEGEVYADFVLLWLLCHQSRVEGEKPEEFWLEKWSWEAQEQGTRALDQLRGGVEDAISALGTGFLSHPTNQALRTRLRSGELDKQDYYRQLLRMVYRLIFLFVAEDRNLLFTPDADPAASQRYMAYYSTQRLRHLAERSRGLRHADLYHVHRLVTSKLGSLDGCPELALPALGGFLFSSETTPDLDQAELPNQNLLDAVRSLAYTVDNRTLRPVDYKNLGPEELGSVYESLLELHPELNVEAGSFNLTSASGHERKTTGSYYTPSSLIQVLLDSALDPVIADRLKAAGTTSENQQSAILDINVCDPACGSGHFLIAAAHRLARHLAAIRTGDDEPSPEATRAALRDVIGHCLYGVDLNPMAVELCKVGLWMEALEPGKPLSFLDAHIKCGNSLVGVGPGLDIAEIPDDAFQAAFGDDKATATALRRRNKREREGQLGFRWDVTLIKDQQDLAQWVARQSRKLEAMPEESAAQIREKEAAYHALLITDHYQSQRLEYDLWTAAFFWPILEGDAETLLAPSQQELLRLRKGEDLDAELTRRVQAIAEQRRFFHWEFEFPTVFAADDPGFDVVLGNPPWDKVELLEKEWFASRDLDIANAYTASKRKKLIDELSTRNPGLYLLYTQAAKGIDGERNFHRTSGRYPLCGRGRINTYAIFAENDMQIVSRRVGIIVPSGIATDDTTKLFFQDIVNRGALHSLFEFENENFFLGAGQGHMIRFCLLTLVTNEKANRKIKFMFQGKAIAELSDGNRCFTLNVNRFKLLNPNTHTCPIFRTRADAELTCKIYEYIPVLEDEFTGKNPWKIQFKQGLFNMSSDSGLFITEPRDGYVALYESKMFYLFTHRYGDHKLVSGGERKHVLPDIPDELLREPNYTVTPHFWVPEIEVSNRLKGIWSRGWLLGFRDVTDSRASIRTAIFSLLPRLGVGNNAPLMLPGVNQASMVSCLLANFCSFIFDFVTRQKLSGLHLNFFIAKQLPVIPPEAYSFENVIYISSRVLELVYTSWDLQPFAEDMGYAGPPFRWDEERRALLRAELDALYAHLYGLNRKQLRYILDPADLTPAELEDILDPWEEVTDSLDPEGYTARAAASDFPGETFRVLKDKDNKQYGEYRTRNLVLAAWERLAAVDFDVESYVPMMDPPPADPRVAHPNRDGSVYEGPGLVIGDMEDGDRRMENGDQLPPAAQKPTEEVVVIESEGESALDDMPPKVEPASTSDYSLYKCQGCGQMVLGFDQDGHCEKVHGGKSQEFGRL